MPVSSYQRAVLARGRDAEHLGTAPNMSWLLADAQHTGGVMSAIRTTLGPGVDGPPPHYHKESPEMFYLLSGALRMLAGDEILTVEKGDYLLVPPFMPHAWGTPPDVDADVLIIKAPGNNRFDYFRLADGIRRGAASPQEILETQQLYDNWWVRNDLWDAELTSRQGERERFVPIPDSDPAVTGKG